MTEKRFKHKWNMLGMQFICYDGIDVLLGTFADKEGVEHIVDVLNELDSENKELKEGVEELNTICKYYEMRIKELSEQADAVREELRLCEEENNALQERNDRQYEILRKLYTLIENKDWKGLTHIWKN